MPIRSVFDRFEEIKPSVAEKIERNSVSISVISSLDERHNSGGERAGKRHKYFFKNTV